MLAHQHVFQGNVLAGAAEMEQGASGVQHGAAGHAHAHAPDVPPGIWAWVKAVPAATSRSIVGVSTHGFPSARMVSKRWSSVKKNRMLGDLRFKLAAQVFVMEMLSFQRVNG